MKITRGFKVRGFILAAAFSAGLGFAASASAQQQVHSYLIDLNSKTVTDIGTLGGPNTNALGVNASGQVVGWSNTAGGATHAFITGPDGMGMRDLGTLGGRDSVALGINDAGQVVGASDPAAGGFFGPRHAFITGPDGAGMMDLNSLVGVPGGLVLVQATGINNVGQVIATIPEPEISALFLAGLALVGFIARRKKMEGEAFSLR